MINLSCPVVRGDLNFFEYQEQESITSTIENLPSRNLKVLFDASSRTNFREGGKYCAAVDEEDLQQVFLWKYLMICKQLQHVDHQSSGRKR